MRTIFVRAAGFGVGVVAAIVAIGLIAWYATRPPSGPWNQAAVTAKYADLFLTTGQPLVFTFRYTVENHTGRDYELPGADNLYRVLANGKGLERDASLKWDGGTSIPSGQALNIGINLEYEYREGSGNLDEKLTAFTKRRLSEMEGFVALDRANRYEIRFPKPPEVK